MIWRADQPPSSDRCAGVKMNYVGLCTLARQCMGNEPNDDQNHVGTPTFGWAGIGVKPNVPLVTNCLRPS